MHDFFFHFSRPPCRGRRQRRGNDPLPAQIIDHHVPAEGDPAPAKPEHLADVAVDHCLAGSPVGRGPVDEYGRGERRSRPAAPRGGRG